jgi:dienelactone hydrolase
LRAITSSDYSPGTFHTIGSFDKENTLMAEIVLFHHVQGLTTGVSAFADELRNAGHSVHTPDLFDGRTFATLDEGMAYARTIGFGTLLESGVTAAQALSLKSGVVYAGFSMGVMPAQRLAQTSANARGALLFHACVPVSEFGERWPNDVPVQIHAMEADPFFTEEGGDIDAASELVASTTQAELFLYPGNEHLFTDSSLPAFEPTHTRLLMQRTLTFLRST